LLLQDGQGSRGIGIEKVLAALEGCHRDAKRAPSYRRNAHSQTFGPACDAGSVLGSSDACRRVSVAYILFLFSQTKPAIERRARLHPIP
jgi:hypothetical protein